MKPYLSVILVIFLCLSANAQRKRSPYGGGRPGVKQNAFLEKQWWIGLKAGTNLSEATPEGRYAVVSPTNYNASFVEKQYDSYNKTGSQATLEITFYIKRLSFSLQPTYRHSRFAYNNRYDWFNTANVAERLELKYDHEQKIDFADIPFLIKYDITGHKLRPYIQAGVYYSFLISASQSVKVSGTDFASGGTNQFSNPPIIIGSEDLFTNYWGWMAGVGLDYNIGNVRLVLEGTYEMGMSNMTNTQNRFSNDRLAGIGEAQDDLNLNNIVISIGVLFPMRFLSNSFRTLD
jgi:hypothetical protein